MCSDRAGRRVYHLMDWPIMLVAVLTVLTVQNGLGRKLVSAVVAVGGEGRSGESCPVPPRPLTVGWRTGGRPVAEAGPQGEAAPAVH